MYAKFVYQGLFRRTCRREHASERMIRVSEKLYRALRFWELSGLSRFSFKRFIVFRFICYRKACHFAICLFAIFLPKRQIFPNGKFGVHILLQASLD